MGGSQGIQEMMASNFAGFATNSGFTGSNQTSKAYKGFRKGRYWQLELNDIERIRHAIPEIEILSPVNSKWGIKATYDKNESSSCSMKGVYPEYAEIETPILTFGRFINHIDIKEQRKVCVIGKQIYENLFPDGSNPCGKFINANGIYYQVIGVNTTSGNMSVNGWPPTTIVIPFSTMQQSYNFGNNIELLCFACHNKRHKRFGYNGKSCKQVFILYGAPCAGKTSYVSEVAQESDLVLDIDKLWTAVESDACSEYQKPDALKSIVFDVRDTIIEDVRTRRGRWENAYIIGGYPMQGERERMQDRIGADKLVYIDTDKETCLQRAKLKAPEWERFVLDWFEKFSAGIPPR
jgi:shikimate kinase